MANEKGLICNIYQDKEGGNHSNDGISNHYNDVLIIVEGKDIGPFEQSEERPTVKVVKRFLFGKDYVHAEPIEKPTGVGWMNGGCIISSCDSRFSEHVNEYPIHLHDRCESQEVNELLSR